MANGEFRSSGTWKTSRDDLPRRSQVLAVHGRRLRCRLSRTHGYVPSRYTQNQNASDHDLSAGVRRALRSVLRTEGLAGLYRGISAMGLGAGPAHAVYFSVYEFSKKAMLSAAARNELGNHGGGGVGLTAAAAHAASGVVAMVASDAVMMPMDVVKQRLQLEGSPYRRVLVGEGIGAFYASYWTTVVMNAPFTAVHFATYEAVKKGMVVVHATAAGGLAAVLSIDNSSRCCENSATMSGSVCGCQRFASSSIQDVISAIVKKDGYIGANEGMDSKDALSRPCCCHLLVHLRIIKILLP